MLKSTLRRSLLGTAGQTLRFQHTKAKSSGVLSIQGKDYPCDEWTNIPEFIRNLANREVPLHKNHNHPIGILRDLIEENFKGMGYTFYNDFNPVVTKFENFDVLGFPDDHPGRSLSDTYYLNANHLLRTHTSAHEHQCFQEMKTPGYFITADVYRKDEIDRTHYPAFHQMEGARVWKQSDMCEQEIQEAIEKIPETDIIVEDPFRNSPFNQQNPKQSYMTDKQCELVQIHLKKTLEYLVNVVFNKAKESAKLAGSTEPYLNEPLKVRWVEAYFPWTSPSWEIEVWWKGEWLECCGCGLVQRQVLVNSGLENEIGWAFGVGLDRIAMLLFGIPDIRLFWTKDERFHNQFSRGKITTFKEYSKHPGIKRDIAFWLPENRSELHTNEVMEVVRNYGGDLVENVSLIDDFTHPKTKRRSQCYRINYQSMDRNLTNQEVNLIQEKVTMDLERLFKISVR